MFLTFDKPFILLPDAYKLEYELESYKWSSE